MRRIVFCAAITWCVASAAQAGWQGTEWGMSPAQVEAAAKGAAPQGPGRQGLHVEGYETGNVGKYEAGGISYEAAFYYKEGGLRLVKVAPPGDKCPLVESRLHDVYGLPFASHPSSIFSRYIWHDEKANNVVELLNLGDSCSVAYTPLNLRRQDTGL